MPTRKQSTPAQKADQHREDRLDEGLEESFPASDPVSIQIEKVRTIAPQPKPDRAKIHHK